MMKKTLCVLLAVVLAVMSFSALAVTANAAESDKVTVVTTSNFFPDVTRTFKKSELAASDNLVTITFFINSENQLLNADWKFIYPEEGAEVRESDNSHVMPIAFDAVTNFKPESQSNSIRCNCSSLYGYYLDTESGGRVGFATVTLHLDGTQDEVNTQFNVYDLKFTKVEPGQMSVHENETQIIFDGEVLDNDLKYDLSTSVYPGQYDEGYQDPEPTVEPTVETTEPYVPTRMLGDVNKDGKISIPDATYVQRHVSEFVNADGSPLIDESNPVEKSVADVNFDGIISIKDITLIQRHVAEMTNADGSPLIDETIFF